MARQDLSEALAPIETETRNTILIGLMLEVIEAGGRAFFAQLLANPINRLTCVYHQVARGNLLLRAPTYAASRRGLL